MVASSTQAFLIIKIMQTLDFYVYLDVLTPSNFVLFLQMITQNVLTIIPNFFAVLADNDINEERDQFSNYGVNVNFFNNLGQWMSLVLLFACGKALLWAINFIVKKFRKGSPLGWLEKAEAYFGVEFFYGLVESSNQDIIVAILIAYNETGRLDQTPFQRASLLMFVTICMFGTLGMYAFMFFRVRKYMSIRATSTAPDADNSILALNPGKSGDIPQKDGSSSEGSEAQDGQNELKPKEGSPADDAFAFWYEDKMNNGNFFQLHFSLITLAKDVILVFLVYFMYYVPIPLIILLSIMQMTFVGLIFKWKPFKMGFMNNQLLIVQGMYIILDFIFLILACVPADATYSNFRYNFLGFPLIACICGLFGVTFYYGIKAAYLAAKSIIQSFRKPSNDAGAVKGPNEVTGNNEISNASQQVNMKSSSASTLKDIHHETSEKHNLQGISRNASLETPILKPSNKPVTPKPIKDLKKVNTNTTKIKPVVKTQKPPQLQKATPK